MSSTAEEKSSSAEAKTEEKDLKDPDRDSKEWKDDLAASDVDELEQWVSPRVGDKFMDNNPSPIVGRRGSQRSGENKLGIDDSDLAHAEPISQDLYDTNEANGVDLSRKVQLLAMELELANRRAGEAETRMREAIQRADLEKQRAYTLDLGMQMREDRHDIEYEDLLQSKKEIEKVAKTLHVELQSSLLLCSKLEEECMFLKQDSSRKTYESTEQAVEKAKEEQLDIFRDLVSRYEANMSRYEEKLADTEESMNLLQADLEDKTNQLASARQKNNALSKLNEQLISSNLALKEKIAIVNEKLIKCRGKFRLFCGVLKDDEDNGEESKTMDPLSASAIDVSKGIDYDERDGPDEIFTDIEPLVKHVVTGASRATIVAYGRPLEGKAATMDGAGGNFGLTLQALESLFLAARDSGEEMDTKFKLCILEVYDDKVKNLLTQRQRAKFEDVDIGDSSESRESGKLLYDFIYDTPVANIQETQRCVERAYQVLNRGVPAGDSDRRSKAHMYIGVKVTRVNLETGETGIGLLSILDLASSEAVTLAGASGRQLYEAQVVNKSLTAIGDLLDAWISAKKVIPFRNSKLSLVLQDSLIAKGNVMMFLFYPSSLRRKDFFVETFLEKETHKVLFNTNVE